MHEKYTSRNEILNVARCRYTYMYMYMYIYIYIYIYICNVLAVGVLYFRARGIGKNFAVARVARGTGVEYFIANLRERKERKRRARKLRNLWFSRNIL